MKNAYIFIIQRKVLPKRFLRKKIIILQCYFYIVLYEFNFTYNYQNFSYIFKKVHKNSELTIVLFYVVSYNKREGRGL